MLACGNVTSLSQHSVLLLSLFHRSLLFNVFRPTYERTNLNLHANIKNSLGFLVGYDSIHLLVWAPNYYTVTRASTLIYCLYIN